MKKITLFLASLFMTIGAVAQVYLPTETKLTSAELNAKTEATYIAIKNLSATNHYWYVGNTGAAPYSKATFSNDAVFIWEPVAGEDGMFYLKKLDGKYMQTSSPKDFGEIGNAAKFTTTNPTSAGSGATKFNGDGDSQAYINGNNDANLVRFVTGSKWINVQNGDAGTPTYNSGLGGWTIHYAYAVEEVSDVDITYNYYDGETLIKSVIKNVGIGTSFPAADDVPNIVTTSGVPTGTVTAEGGAFNIQCALVASFPFKGSFALTTRDGEKWLIANEGGQALSTTPLTIQNIANVDDYAWTLEGTWYNGFNFKNQGTDKYLAAPSENPADGAASTLTETVDGLAKFDVVLNGGNYYIKLRGTVNSYLSDFGGGTNASLKFWNSASSIGDAGSKFVVQTTDPETLLNEFKSGYAPVVGCVGGYNTTADVINALTVETAGAFFAANEKIALTPGYYFIKATNSDKYITYSNKGLVYSALNGGEKLGAKHVVKFVADESDNMKLQLTNLGKFVTLQDAAAIGGGASKIEADIAGGSTFTIEDKGNAKFLVKGNGNVMRVESSGNVNYWASDKSFTWYLIPATELEIDITAAGWATTHLPFAVEVPNTLKAYAVTQATTYANLEAKSVIPANEGVILEGAEGSHTFTITTAAAWAEDANILEGTNVNTYVEGSAYVLGIPEGETEATLCLTTLNKNAEGTAGTTHFLNNANKAYLPASVVATSANTLRFNFGGTTAIESVLNNGVNANAPIYDLSGRRVMNAVKGGIYIQNGKKFIVK